MDSPLVHFQLYARDAERLGSFYREVLGWTFRPRRITSPDTGLSGTYGWLEPAGEKVSGGLTAVGEPKGVVLMVAVDDVDGTLHRAERLGGTVLGPSEHLELESEEGEADAFLMTSFQDPEGNTVAIIERSS